LRGDRLSAIVAIAISAAACRGSPPSRAGIAGPTPVACLDHTFTGHSGILRQVAFSPDSQLLATSSAEGTVKLWRVADRSLVKTLTHPAGVTSVAFSRDGRWVVSGSYDQVVRIWSLHDRTLPRLPNGHSGTVWSVAFSPDGQWLASSSVDRTVKLWRLQVNR